MCGIIGVSISKNSKLNKKAIQKITFELLKLSESRGKESSGMAIKNFESGNIGVYKAPIPASELIVDPNFLNYFNLNLSSTHFNGLSLIAHARLVTNGSEENNNNNQPVIKDGFVAVHNGIIVNVEELWKSHSNLNKDRLYEVDTEFFFSYLNENLQKGTNFISSFKKVIAEIYGTVSIGVLHDKSNNLLIFTNHGSLYTLRSDSGNEFIFASEKQLLLKLAENISIESQIGSYRIEHLEPDTIGFIDLNASSQTFTSLKDLNSKDVSYFSNEKGEIRNYTPDTPIDFSNLNQPTIPASLINSFEFNAEEIGRLKRCTKCILPSTIPFISFDEKGVCNFCNEYLPSKLIEGADLLALINKDKTGDSIYDCLVPISGGRDSCYTLHYLVEELGLKPLAYTYDWGMVTDLARRNISRMCSKLKVEHIIVSADIRDKRGYIKSNVNAWLKKPHLGAIPLFMAGDKMYFKYAYELAKSNNIKAIVMGENYFEKTNFKFGFAGISKNKGGLAYSIGLSQKLSMITFYLKEFISNPSYLNKSLVDTFKGFVAYYFTPHDYLNLFDYVKWDEEIVENILIEKYQWELSPDTTTTWRIGDGTAAFYNYIYYTVCGFSEFDTFRSNQIREGALDRMEALNFVNQENKPRIESFKWYCDTIGVDSEMAVKTINAIPKLYRKN
jgi:glucosamine--fructose-6-phosphate aminotransferase (isomerizing)